MYIWGDDRRFNSYNSYFTRKFGGRVQKISIDAGFSCPNRGHDFAAARRAIELTHRYGFPCGGHFIFGLPGETRDMMLHAADIISGLPLTTVKFHQLQIFKDTAMAEEYLSHPSDFRLFTLEEYIDFVIDFVERLNPNIVIERFAGEVPPRFLVSKPWESLRYDQVLAMIERCMEERGTWQGRRLETCRLGV